jgi:hypothetical protein
VQLMSVPQNSEAQHFMTSLSATFSRAFMHLAKARLLLEDLKAGPRDPQLVLDRVWSEIALGYSETALLGNRPQAYFRRFHQARSFLTQTDLAKVQEILRDSTRATHFPNDHREAILSICAGQLVEVWLPKACRDLRAEVRDFFDKIQKAQNSRRIVTRAESKHAGEVLLHTYDKNILARWTAIARLLIATHEQANATRLSLASPSLVPSSLRRKAAAILAAFSCGQK